MPENEKPFWVYSHTPDGDIYENLGEYKELEEAIEGVSSALNDKPFKADLTYRVVDNREQAGGSTVWIAGPGNMVVSLEELNDGRVVLHRS